MKKQKFPHLSGKPPPSKFNRTMYQRFGVIKDPLGNKAILRTPVGSIVEGYDGRRYQVQEDGSIRNVV